MSELIWIFNLTFFRRVWTFQPLTSNTTICKAAISHESNRCSQRAVRLRTQPMGVLWVGVAVAATTAYDNQPTPPQPHSRQLFRLPLLSRRRLHHFSKPAIPQTGLFPNYPIFSAYFPSELGAQNRKNTDLRRPSLIFFSAHCFCYYKHQWGK